MKYKYYLRGAGIGLIVGVVIMAIAIKLQNSTISDAEIIQRAQELGMVYVSDLNETENGIGASSELSTEGESISDTDETPAAADDETDTKGEDSATNKKNDTEKSEDTESAEKSKQDSEKTDSDNEKEDEETPADYYTIRIGGSDFSDVVASKLEAAGVIDDADDFNNYLIANGYDSYIQPGEVNIPADASYEDIAKLLVTKSDER